MPESFRIANHTFSNNARPWCVAELSGNHGGSLQRALDLVKAAADAGVDAIKTQLYTPDSLTLAHNGAAFTVQSGLWKGRTLHDLYTEAQTPYPWQPKLKALAEQLGLVFFATPFDIDGVDFLEKEITPELYKLASFELLHDPLLERIAATGKPLIASTGMATYSEIEYTANYWKKHSKAPLILLQCVSAYPADAKDFNLRRLPALAETFGCFCGLSDHTIGATVPIAATALGAKVIEKHLCLSRQEDVIDGGFSMEPAEFAAMVKAVQQTHTALGSAEIKPAQQEAHERNFRRSIYVASTIAEGETLTAENLRIVRPNGGLDPRQWKAVIGKKASRSLHYGEPLREGDFS